MCLIVISTAPYCVDDDHKHQCAYYGRGNAPEKVVVDEGHIRHQEFIAQYRPCNTNKNGSAHAKPFPRHYHLRYYACQYTQPYSNDEHLMLCELLHDEVGKLRRKQKVLHDGIFYVKL
mgnify:CR=1 FL=1